MFGKKKKETDTANITSQDRQEAIRRLERERLKINAEIESILKMYAKESGNRALSHRKYKIGESPNDYTYGTKKKK